MHHNPFSEISCQSYFLLFVHRFTTLFPYVYLSKYLSFPIFIFPNIYFSRLLFFRTVIFSDSYLSRQLSFQTVIFLDSYLFRQLSFQVVIFPDIYIFRRYESYLHYENPNDFSMCSVFSGNCYIAYVPFENVSKLN